MLYPVLVVREGLVGYLDLWEVISFPYAEARYYPCDPSSINWEEMDWIYGDIKVPNHEGKWALFGYDWEPLVDFVLDREPHATRHGQYSFGGPDRMSKRQFFEQYGVRG